MAGKGSWRGGRPSATGAAEVDWRPPPQGSKDRTGALGTPGGGRGWGGHMPGVYLLGQRPSATREWASHAPFWTDPLQARPRPGVCGEKSPENARVARPQEGSGAGEESQMP